MGTLTTRRRSGSGREIRSGSYRPRRERRRRLSGLILVLGLAAGMVAASYVLLGPALSGFAHSMAEDNPDLLRFGFFRDAVRTQLGDKLSEPAGSDSTPVQYTVESGATAGRIGEDLQELGLIADPLVLEYLVATDNEGGTIKAGVHVLDRTMTPQQILAVLQQNPPPVETRVTVALRQGLRIEQVTAYLLTLELELDVAEFYRLATQPSPALRQDYPVLATLPDGRSLEGYLGGGIFEVDPEISAEELLRILLDRRTAEIGALAGRPPPAPLTDFYQVLTVASIVDHETGVAAERPLVAGVYINRLRGLAGPTILNADPTVIYAKDSLALRALPLPQWVNHVFWTPVPGLPGAFNVPPDLTGYQTYQNAGLPPGPISSPSVAAIQAVYGANTRTGFLYFVACPGAGEHTFAKNFNEHQQNVNRCRQQANRTPAPPTTQP